MVMKNSSEAVLSINKPTLALSSGRAISFQVLLIIAAVALPVIAHLLGAPVRFLLPMHWPVILAGLVYGWRGGALAGFFAPIVSYFFSGFPVPAILPSMTLELLTYGLIAGLFREKTRMNSFLSVSISLLLGRVVFMISAILSNVTTIGNIEYIQIALLPGVGAAVCQIALLPFVAKWWMGQELKNGKR
jgi:hypothetical protein